MATKPPYPKGTLKKPLTKPQRQAVIAYLVKSGAPFPAAALAKESDEYLISNYDELVTLQATGGYQPGDPITNTGKAAVGAATAVAHTAGDFFSALFDPALWLRVLEIGIGLVLLGVGLAKLTSMGPALSKIPAYGKLIPS